VAERLRRSGVHLWLDDFGTGYSSLLSLRQISLQAVKIDIAFVANIHTDPAAKRFLRALLALGRDLDLLVTAEGVELPEQAQILRSLGCQLAQGFLYAHPAPAADFDHLLGPLAQSDLMPDAPGVRPPVSRWRTLRRENSDSDGGAFDSERTIRTAPLPGDARGVRPGTRPAGRQHRHPPRPLTTVPGGTGSCWCCPNWRGCRTSTSLC